ncbi:MAG: vanadium-dependent haloperoxidase [Bryobacteraceae bacterium]
MSGPARAQFPHIILLCNPLILLLVMVSSPFHAHTVALSVGILRIYQINERTTHMADKLRRTSWLDTTRIITQNSAHEKRRANGCETDPSRPASPSRRALLKGAAAFIAAGEALPSTLGVDDRGADLGANGSGEDEQRREQAFQVRLRAALQEKRLPSPGHPTNGDEETYPNKIGNFSKGLPHNDLGEVNLGAYQALTDALSSGRFADFEAIPLGCADSTTQRKFVNPLAGLAFDLEGADCHHFATLPAPAFSSAHQAAEITELYWQALLRDVPFSEYETHPLAQMAAADLSKLSDFRGPKEGRSVTPRSLFRGVTAGDLSGPYVSQFLLKPIPFGVQFIDQRMRTVMPGFDHMTDFAEWLNIQKGCSPAYSVQIDPVHRYVRNGRDMDRWVNIDVLYQAFFNASLILVTPPDLANEDTGGGMGAPLNPGNPYNRSRTQTGFGTFGGPHISVLVPEVASRVLKAVWHQKWFVHRRLRPEAFAGRIHNLLTHPGLNYPIHRDVLNSAALDQIFRRNRTYLLPQGYPEGSPLHPAYTAGHAGVAGACVTILKALVDESFPISNPVVPATDGLSLLPYRGPELTVGGELNKLAGNIAMGRNFAGIHWRADYAESLKLGEAVAISVLRDQKLTYREDFSGFTFTKFDGTQVTV